MGYLSLEKEAEDIAKSIMVEPWEGEKKTSWNMIRLEVFTNAHNYKCLDLLNGGLRAPGKKATTEEI